MLNPEMSFRSLASHTIKSLDEHPLISATTVALGAGVIDTGVEAIANYERLELVGLGRVVLGITCIYAGTSSLVHWWKNRKELPQTLGHEIPTTSIVTRPINSLHQQMDNRGKL